MTQRVVVSASQEPKKLKLTSQSHSRIAGITSNGIKNRLTVNMDQNATLVDLKQLAIERGLCAERVEERRLKEMDLKAQMAEINILPSICSALRTSCLMNKSFSQTLSSCTSKLAGDFRMAKANIRHCISIIEAQVPEFLSIQPPDDIVPVATVKINSTVEFSRVHKKITEFVFEKVAELSQINSDESTAVDACTNS